MIPAAGCSKRDRRAAAHPRLLEARDSSRVTIRVTVKSATRRSRLFSHGGGSVRRTSECARLRVGKFPRPNMNTALVPKAGVGAQQLRAARAGARDARDELLDEPQRAPCGVRRTRPGTDVQHLASLRARGEDRVV